MASYLFNRLLAVSVLIGSIKLNSLFVSVQFMCAIVYCVVISFLDRFTLQLRIIEESCSITENSSLKP